MRDAKHPEGAALEFSRDSWTAFLAGISEGQFDVN
jgi:hypothetical protein